VGHRLLGLGSSPLKCKCRVLTVCVVCYCCLFLFVFCRGRGQMATARQHEKIAVYLKIKTDQAAAVRQVPSLDRCIDTNPEVLALVGM
jgi:hypothetical protein